MRVRGGDVQVCSHPGSVPLLSQGDLAERVRVRSETKNIYMCIYYIFCKMYVHTCTLKNVKTVRDIFFY